MRRNQSVIFCDFFLKMKKENNNVFQILFGKFLFGLFDLASCFSKRKNNHIRHLVGNLSDCIESRYVHLLPSDRSAGMLFFWGGKENLLFFSFLKMSRRLLFMCCVMCGRAHAPGGCCVYVDKPSVTHSEAG